MVIYNISKKYHIIDFLPLLILQSLTNKKKQIKQRAMDTEPQSTSTNIHTMVRLRPLISTEQEEKQSIFCNESQNNLTIHMSGGRKHEKLDKVFQKTCTQRGVFQHIQPFISRCKDGNNVTVLTYGQTGSGKTYTMFGSDWDNILQTGSEAKSKQSTFLRSLEQDENHAGIIPRTIHHIFDVIIKKRRKHIKVYCSFLQLYNENMMDLFQDDRTKMNKKMFIHENKQDGVYVEGINEVEVGDIDECLALMQRGERNRVVRQTTMNVKSSRSHTLFQLLIEEVFPAKKSFRRMKVNLCDLAGSEKINKNQKMEQEHLDELKNINLSLTTLGKVISSLSDKDRPLPPYRQSKLTRLLQDSLGGNTFTAIIATITSKSACLEESLNTLKFLERASHIKTEIITKMFTDNPEMRNLEKQIAYLKDVLKMKRTGVEVDVNMADRMKRLQAENRKLKEMVDTELVNKLVKQNNILKRELDKKASDQIATEIQYKTVQKESQSQGKDARENSAKDISEGGYSFSTNKIQRKQKKFLSTKTYTTTNNEIESVNTQKQNTSSKLFPSIRSIPQKNTVNSILSRIQEIQRAKQINKLKLQHDLSLIDQVQSLQTKKTLGKMSKYSNSRYN